MSTILILKREDLSFLLNRLNLVGEGCQIGVQKGCFSEALLANWLGKKLHSIDSWKHTSAAEDSRNRRPTSEIDAVRQADYEETLLRLYPFSSRSVVWRISSAEASLRFANDSLDFIYFHSHESHAAVSEEIGLWYPKLRPGGILAGHDFVPEAKQLEVTASVSMAIEQFARANQLALFFSDEENQPSRIVQKPVGFSPIAALESHPKPYVGVNTEPMSRPTPHPPSKSRIVELGKRLFKKNVFSRAFWVLRKSYQHLSKLPNIYEDLRTTQAIQQLISPLQRSCAADANTYCPSYEIRRLGRKLSYREKVTDKAQPTIVTVIVNDSYATEVGPGLNSVIKYCEEHRYNFVILRETPPWFLRPIPWLKIPLLHHLLMEGYDKLLFLDGDVMITNRHIKLEPFFLRLEAANKHLLLAEDYYTINTGVMFVKNCWKTRNLLDLIYCNDAKIGHFWWEQQSLLDLLNRVPWLNNLLIIETQARLFNAMPFGDHQRNLWKPGDFLCHFASYRGNKLAREFDRIREASQDYFDHSPYQPASALIPPTSSP